MVMTLDKQGITQGQAQGQSLTERVYQSVRDEINSLSGNVDGDIYNRIIERVEAALLKSIMLYNKNNQSKSAKQLGISRGTMRTKLKKYFGDTYISIRDNEYE